MVSDSCDVEQARCSCILPAGHETPHVCECGGTFQRVGDELKVWHLPPIFNPKLGVNEALERANDAARHPPLLVEDATATVPPRDMVFRAPRGANNFFRVPSIDEIDEEAGDGA